MACSNSTLATCRMGLWATAKLPESRLPGLLPSTTQSVNLNLGSDPLHHRPRSFYRGPQRHLCRQADRQRSIGLGFINDCKYQVHELTSCVNAALRVGLQCTFCAYLTCQPYPFPLLTRQLSLSHCRYKKTSILPILSINRHLLESASPYRRTELH